jgi:hypothetical protein
METSSPKGCRLTTGVSSRESLTNHPQKGKQMTAGYGLSWCALWCAESMRWLQVRIVKLRQTTSVAAHPTKGAFEMLEPCALRGACTVPRGLGASNGPWLPDGAR